ncbi:MAG: ABC transporter substrate-binding protein [Candidatus Limnocylindrales bacterium]
MRSSIRAAGAALAVALLAGACSGSTTPSASQAPSAPAGASGAPASTAPTTPPTASAAAEPVTLTYFTFSAAPDHLNDLDAIIKAFNVGHPNIKIDVQTAAYADYFTKLQAEIAGGTAPDTFELNYENFVGYASAGSLQDLTPIAAADASYNAATFYPRAYQVFQAGGKQYGLPENFSDVLLFYNKDLFDKGGVAYPTATWTWADEQAAAEKLTSKSAGTWGDFQNVQFFEFYKALAQNGGSFFDAGKTKSTFNDAKGVEAAQWLINKVGKVMPSNAFGADEDTALFKSGKLAMWHNGIWQFTGLKDAQFGWDVVVEPGNTQKASHFFADAVVASSATKHPAEAWAWLRFLTSSPEAVKTRLDASWELPAVADTSMFSSYLSQTPPSNRKAVFDALDAIVVPPVIDQQSQMQDIVTGALDKARLGQMSVQDALNDAASQVDALLK